METKIPLPHASDPKAPWLVAVEEQLEKVMALQDGWCRTEDGKVGSAVSHDCMKDTLSILDSIMDKDTSSPHVVPTVDGGLRLEWYNKGRYLELEVSTNGTMRAVYDDWTHLDKPYDLILGSTMFARIRSTLTRFKD